ncbi:MAG: hypothetical protein AAGL99_07880 [Pseudomonadota bacterium]
MTQIDPNIPRLVDLKRKAQERRLLEITNEMRDLEQKLSEVTLETQKIDSRQDEFGRLSVENGYLNYVNHRRAALIRQIKVLKEQAKEAQEQLKKSVYSQSMLQN